MGKVKLGSKEIKELISKYETTVNVLSFELAKSNQILEELQKMSDTKHTSIQTTGKTKAAPEPARRGRKPGTKNKKNKAGRKPRLSDWDNLIINRLKETGKVMQSSDMFKHAKSAVPHIADDEIKIKINRTLQKLSNRHKVLVKNRHAGRGFVYGLNEWSEKDGVIKNEYREME